jgi:glycosyltransferase involved in cell wall biosynthesis
MRIAIDARYLREKPSGIGTYVKAIVDRLPQLAPSDQFLFWAHPLAPRPLSDALNARDVTVRPGPNSPAPVWWPNRYSQTADVDVFHSPHNIMSRGMRCPTVVTVLDVMAIDHPGLHLQGFERLALRLYYPQAVWRALRHATRLIVPSLATADRIRVLVPEAGARLRVIWLAPDRCFHPAPDRDDVRRRASALTGMEDPYLLVVGADSPTKRHARALAAFAAAAPKPWRLVMLQRPGTYDHLRRLSRLKKLARRLHVEDRVIWLPHVPQDDVAVLIQNAGALLQPSIYEGFGLPVVEAMACGCPVVATDIAPFREIADGAALLVPPDDVGALASAVREVVTSATRRQSMVESGLARAGQFSWDRCARETLDVYREAASCASPV